MKTKLNDLASTVLTIAQTHRHVTPRTIYQTTIKKTIATQCCQSLVQMTQYHCHTHDTAPSSSRHSVVTHLHHLHLRSQGHSAAPIYGPGYSSRLPTGSGHHCWCGSVGQ